MIVYSESNQRHTEPPKAARGQATFSSLCIDNIVLLLLKFWLSTCKVVYSKITDIQHSFSGRWQQGIQVLISVVVAKCHSSEGRFVSFTHNSSTGVAVQIQRKYHRMQVKHSLLSTTARCLLLRKLESKMTPHLDLKQSYSSRFDSRLLLAQGGGQQEGAVDCCFMVSMTIDSLYLIPN